MAKEVEQVTLSPEEQLLNDHVENLLKVVDPGHGVPLQQELSLRLEKTVNEFHDEIAEMIEELKTNSEERRKKLKELWEHRNDEKPAVQETVIEEEDPGEISAWEKRLEIKEKSKKYLINKTIR